MNTKRFTEQFRQNHPPLILLNTPVDVVSQTQTLALISQFMQEPGVHQICTTNPEFVMNAQQDAHFQDILWRADLSIPDGIGLLYAARWRKQPLPERVPGSELIYHLAEKCAREGWRLFLLGAAPGVAEETAVIFQDKYPSLQIAGTYAGSPDPAENDQIVGLINASQADVLCVAYGNPKQDKWIDRNKETLTTVRLAIGIGGAFDFVTGRSLRAPIWMQRLGLEWVHRLWQEPWRWRRMLSIPKFMWAVAREKNR